MSDAPSRRQRRQVEKRAAGYCEYCRSAAKYAVQSFECEHIIPLSQGGKTDLANLAFACGGCNRCKSTKTKGKDPDSGEIAPLYNPRQQRWSDHFAWSEDFTLIVGLTATGRATVKTLRLNRAGLVNLRRVLIIASKHPPIEKS
jgi:5-methylcytosine-specific restriction endonuclease McrA